MSIIYEALKRIEKKTKAAEENPVAPKRKAPKFRRIIYVLIALAVLSFIALFGDRLFIEKSPTDKSLSREKSSTLKIPLIPPVPKERAPAKVVPLSSPQKETPTAEKLPPLYITGIFFSDGEYLALINNQMVKTGDSIEGIQIEKIDSNGADIKSGNSSFRLNYP